jgi:hypothetical protein
LRLPCPDTSCVLNRHLGADDHRINGQRQRRRKWWQLHYDVGWHWDIRSTRHHAIVMWQITTDATSPESNSALGVFFFTQEIAKLLCRGKNDLDG